MGGRGGGRGEGRGCVASLRLKKTLLIPPICLSAHASLPPKFKARVTNSGENNIETAHWKSYFSFIIFLIEFFAGFPYIAISFGFVLFFV